MFVFEMKSLVGLCLILMTFAASSQTLKISTPATSYEPGQSETDLGEAVLAEVFDPLLLMGEDWNLSPLGASSWVVENNGSRYRFIISDNNYWSDGEKVTASDYAAGVRIAASKASNYRYKFPALLDEHDNVRVWVDGEKELIVDMASPYAVHPSFFSMGLGFPRPTHLLKNDDEKWSELDHKVCNGPMCPVSMTSKGVSLKPNLRYREKVYWQGIDFIHHDNFSKPLADYRHGNIDVYPYVPARQVQWARKFLPNEVYDVNSVTAAILVYRNHGGKLGDVRFRRALAKSINYDYIAKITANPDPRYYGLIPKGFDGFNSSHNPKTILDVWPREAVTLSIRVYRGLTSELIANQLKRDWYKLNVKLEIQKTEQPWEEYQKDFHSGEFDIAIEGHLANYYSSFSYLNEFSKELSSGDYSPGVYIASAKYDKMVNNARLQKDPRLQRNLANEAEYFLLHDLVGTITFPIIGHNLIIAKPWLGGVADVVASHPNRMFRWSKLRLKDNHEKCLAPSDKKQTMPSFCTNSSR